MDTDKKQQRKTAVKKNWWRGAIILLLSLLLVFLYLARSNKELCEVFFAKTIGRGYIYLISRITNLLPFSLTEWVYIAAVILLVFLFVRFIFFLVKKKYGRFFKSLFNIASIILGVLVLFNATFTCSYSRKSVMTAFELPEVTMTTEECADASIYYATLSNELAAKLDFDENGDVVCPYTFDELVSLINEEYHRFDGEYFSSFELRAKPVFFSKFMSYSGITGQFQVVLGECNVSTDIPTYQVPETIAHEIAHGKGVSREDEANYSAYYLLLTSDNDYLKYCGLLYASNKMLYESYDSNNPADYYRAREYFEEHALTQYQNASAHWASYDTIWDKITDWWNDRYLKSSGQSEGVKSYSMTGRFLLQIYEMQTSED